MKKLLSLLSVLTISGTAIPTTIAASPYQKEETIKNSDINYQQTNNLEILKRNKREKKKGFTTSTLRISYNAIEFFKDLYKILNRELGSDENNIVIDTLDNNSNQRFFVINPDSDIDYFEIPLNIDNQEGFRLIFRASDFYLQGFVIPVENNNTTRQVYYYFDDAEIQTLEGVFYDENLGYNSSYINLVNAQSQEVTWTGIYNSFDALSHFNGNNSNKDKLKKVLAQIILATSESMRFVGVKNLILSTYNSETILNWERDFSSIINNWSRMTQDAINFYEENSSFSDFAWRVVVLILTRNAFSYVSRGNSQCKNPRILNNECSEYKYFFDFPEKTIHWRDDKKSFEIINDWYSNKLSNVYIWSEKFELGSTNPKNYNRIEFLGDTSNSRISWGNNPYYATGFNLIEKSDFQKFLKNGNNDGCDQGQVLVGGPVFILQNLQQKKGKSSINGDQWIAFCYYKNNSNYYLRVSVLQRVDNNHNSKNGTLFLYIGRGLRLYNDDDNNYAYFSARENENDNLQLLIQYSHTLYSEAIKYFEYHWSKFKEYLNYFTIENIYSYLKNF